jgi:hypothetical protein
LVSYGLQQPKREIKWPHLSCRDSFDIAAQRQTPRRSNSPDGGQIDCWAQRGSNSHVERSQGLTDCTTNQEVGIHIEGKLKVHQRYNHQALSRYPIGSKH